jgi:hypothetical protein
MDLREIGLGGVDWIRLAQDRDRWRAFVSAVMNLRVLAPRSYLVMSLHYTTHILYLSLLLKTLCMKAPLKYTHVDAVHFVSVSQPVNLTFVTFTRSPLVVM